MDNARKEKGIVQKNIGEFMKKKETPPPELMMQKKKAEEEIEALEYKEKELKDLRDITIHKIGNLVPDDVPVDDDEDNNLVVDTNGAFERQDWMLSHYDLVTLAVRRTHRTRRRTTQLRSACHAHRRTLTATRESTRDLVHELSAAPGRPFTQGMANTVKGSVVAGSRGYFLTGLGMRLNQALIS